jgi:carbon-monoxide dehydrogenase iron sulfur subunit
MKRISIDRSLCNHCGICQFVCSVVKTGKGNPKAGRIRVHQEEGKKSGYVSVCQHCEEPACVSACLKGIIEKRENGEVCRDTDRCISCGACAVFCPTGAVIQDPETEKYVTCDLCGGAPICVSFCPTGALAYEDEAETAKRRRSRAGEEAFEGPSLQAAEICADEIDWDEIEKKVKEALS